MMAEISKELLFVVEGKDEVNFFDAFLKHFNISDFEIRQVEGKDNFKLVLKTLKSSSGFRKVKKLILIRDGDENSEGAFKSLQNILNELALPVPEAEGALAVKNDLICGIYIMPLYPESGMLEDLCLLSIGNTKEMQCIDEFLNCVENKPNHIAKAKTQIYLSLRSPIVNSLGLAAQKGHWDFDHSCFQKLLEFVKKV